MKTITDKNRIEEIFNRGVVVDVLPSKEEFIKKLQSGERLKIYIGADATSNSLHLSHAKNYMFLEELRQLGHEVVVLFGDFTAQIGDPTGKNAARPQLSAVEIKKNVKNWLKQIKPLMNFADKVNPPKIAYNSKWLSKLTLSDVIKLASNFTVQQMIERDMFEKRWNENVPIYLHEFLYPLMQGYDSVAMNVDVELCGTDQTFNALAGRLLQKRLNNKDKYVVTVNLMANPKTGALMSKSQGTGVFLSSPANEMYGAVMAQPDEMIEVLFVNVTRIPLSEKKAILDLGPRDAKAKVALEIVKKFYGEKKALAAQAAFVSQFSKGELPEDIEVKTLPAGSQLISGVIAATMGISKSEARRLIAQGGVKIDSEVVKADGNLEIGKKEILFQVGKRRFVKIKAE
ncbi:MAG: tyrosine--tRNA ligase [Candidatus Doudnabacteria bacterium]|nr:tyrosine--tRNA ligase [Candidatus Doudnabacteria bacterium]